MTTMGASKNSARRACSPAPGRSGWAIESFGIVMNNPDAKRPGAIRAAFISGLSRLYIIRVSHQGGFDVEMSRSNRGPLGFPLVRI